MTITTFGVGKGSISIDLKNLGLPEKKWKTAQRRAAGKRDLTNVRNDKDGWLYADFRFADDYDYPVLAAKMRKIETWLTCLAQNLMNATEQTAQDEKLKEEAKKREAAMEATSTQVLA